MRKGRKRKASPPSSEADAKKLSTEDCVEADTIESCALAAESDKNGKDDERRLIESTMIELLIQRGPEKTC